MMLRCSSQLKNSTLKSGTPPRVYAPRRAPSVFTGCDGAVYRTGLDGGREPTGGELSGVGFWKCSDRVERGQAWQDDATTAYWDIATYFSEPEGRDVLPPGSVSMDGRGHYPHAALKQTASGGVSVMECGHGVRPVMCADRGESV